MRGIFIAPCLAAQAWRPGTEERVRLQERAQRRTAAAAAAVEGAGYNSDEEVYAVARAVDADAEVRTRPAKHACVVSAWKVWIELITYVLAIESS